MKFCPECDAKMRPKKIIDESSSKSRPKPIIVCSTCGYQEKLRRVTVKEKKIEDTKNIKVVDPKNSKPLAGKAERGNYRHLRQANLLPVNLVSI